MQDIKLFELEEGKKRDDVRKASEFNLMEELIHVKLTTQDSFRRRNSSMEETPATGVDHISTGTTALSIIIPPKNSV